jgi:hypothetical protein
MTFSEDNDRGYGDAKGVTDLDTGIQTLVETRMKGESLEWWQGFVMSLDQRFGADLVANTLTEWLD